MDSEGVVQNARGHFTNRENENLSGAKKNEGAPRRTGRIDRLDPCNDSYFDDLIFHGVPHQLADGVQFQFSHDVGAMGFGSFHADI